MPHPSKRKGDAAELEVARLLAALQVKNYPTDIQRAVRETLAELPAQQANAGAAFAAGLVRRPGGRWFAVMDLDQLTTLLREATTPDVGVADIGEAG